MSRVIQKTEALAQYMDKVVNIPFDIVRPWQGVLSDRIGTLALSLQARQHRFAANCVARCCEVTAIQADDAVVRTYDELQAQHYDPQRVRPDPIDVVPRILAMNEERRNSIS